MTERTYLDFDVRIEPGSAGGYRARVLNSPVGETRPVPVTIPFSELELENFLLRIGRPRRHLVRGEDAPEAIAVRLFGGRLFDAVFHDQVGNALTASRDLAESRDAGLRVRLRLTDSPELADLPWEYLYDRDARRFLALSEWTPRWCATSTSPAASACWRCTRRCGSWCSSPAPPTSRSWT